MYRKYRDEGIYYMGCCAEAIAREQGFYNVPPQSTAAHPVDAIYEAVRHMGERELLALRSAVDMALLTERETGIARGPEGDGC